MDNNSIVFFSKKASNRLFYVAELVFQDLLGLAIHFTQDENEYRQSPLPKIMYGRTPLSNLDEKLDKQVFLLENQAILFENDLSTTALDLDFSLFLVLSPLDFDVLATIFLLVTRYEEYVVEPTLLDNHGRFSAKVSIAQKFGFLQKPIVNQWVMKIKKHLNEVYPELKTTVPTFAFQPSFDVDMPWKYKNKGLFRTLGGFAKDMMNGNVEEMKNRADILRGVKSDPDFTFDYIFEWHKRYGLKPIFFFLLGDHAEFDKNPDVGNPSFQELVKHISTFYEVGLHPSYRSNTDEAVFKKEKDRFETLSSQSLIMSRQHFLKLRFPKTFHNVLALGVKHEYSMGYADDIGFRAGIATPFRWFDLSKNEVTDLWIHPFQVMDVTLKDYLKLSPNEAVERVKQLIDDTKTVGGTFVSLWHNSSFSDTEGWESWREVYEKIALNGVQSH